MVEYETVIIGCARGVGDLPSEDPESREVPRVVSSGGARLLLFDLDAVDEGTGTGLAPNALNLRVRGWKWAASLDPKEGFTGEGATRALNRDGGSGSGISTVWRRSYGPLDNSPTSVDSRAESASASLPDGLDFFLERPRNGIRLDFFFRRLGVWLLVDGTSRVYVDSWLWVETSLSGCRVDDEECDVRKNSVISEVLLRIRRGLSPDMAKA